MSQTVFITGASSGIGQATALFFQAKGWNVVATMRKPEADEVLTGLEGVEVLRLDVLDVASIEAAVARAIERFGRIDVLVNNAGYGAYGTLESYPRENILRQFNTNVIGLLDVTRTVTPYFRMQNSGTLINISSILGKIAFPLGSLYTGTKYAVEGISEALRFEFDEIGAQVKLIEPGGVNTDFGGRSLDFQHDTNLTTYNTLVTGLMKAFEQAFSNPEQLSTPEQVAAVIFEAATDGTNQFRYPVGLDAAFLLEQRAKLDDTEFMALIKKQFNL